MKYLSFLFIAMILSSCATKYGFIAGVQKTSYQEKVSANAALTGDNILLPEYENDSKGFHFGIVEESSWFVTKIAYFQNNYDDKAYVVNNSSNATKLKESGFWGSIGMKFWYLVPNIAFKKYTGEYTINGNNSEASYTGLGFGVDFEYPISDSTYIYVGYLKDAYDEFVSPSGTLLLVQQEFRHTTITLGIRYDFAKFGSN